ncbi:sigma-70 family RNA polymerase sigma factor [Barnesiella sp. An55]|uniref:RNA polymerase sigma factor n=1 Tax=Barnesiella sp. An55 TaxID=1965646 RepID=UPI000B36CC93|nr:sigma-70 family RNA polymerase sigma factor [Barnesiella sp. An55]OUN70259.1 RNA polymerase subunit sigma-70 [Barnesiella sp. An55]HIZ27285.1 sigma-70 family RNA polymerase sigma factor [Candidatus Barnesiella merdipullorum]
MEKTEDMMWVARCALLDDRKAFASLVDKYQGRVKRFFLSLTGGDESLSDDLAQETFIKVYYHLRSYKGLSSFSTWLFRVAYNLYYDELRKRGDRYFEPLDRAAAIPQSPEPVDRRLDMTQALSVLRPEERTVVTLYFVEDMAIARIAAVTGMPEGTIKSYLSRAKQKLGEYLKKNGYERVE